MRSPPGPDRPEHLAAVGRHAWLTANGFALRYLPVYATLIFSGLGEVSALVALDHRHATKFEHAWVNASVRGLTVITVAGVMIAVSRQTAREAISARTR
jgi:hypothetical protein